MEAQPLGSPPPPVEDETCHYEGCHNCGNGAHIECLLCLKNGVRPAPCFCSKSCYEAHWTIHKQLKRTPWGMVPVGSVYEYRPVERHTYEASTSASGFYRHGFPPSGDMPYFLKHFLMAAQAQPILRHE